MSLPNNKPSKDRIVEFPDDLDVTLTHEWVRDLIECPVCYGIPRPPIKTCVIGHIVCNSCQPQTHGICPVCRSPYSQTRSFVAEGIVERHCMPVPCQYAENGCKTSVKRAEMGAHAAECKFRPVQCKYFASGCQICPTFREFDVHLTKCLYRPVICKYFEDGCEAIVNFCDLNAHLKDCNYRPCPCKLAKSGCEAIHLSDCAYRPIKCPWCPEERLAIDYESYPNHLRSKCSTVPNQLLIRGKEYVRVDTKKLFKIWGECRKDLKIASISCRLSVFTGFNQTFVVQMAHCLNNYNLSIAFWVSLVAPKSIKEYKNYKVVISYCPRNQTDEIGWKTEDPIRVNNFRDDAVGVVKKGGALLIPMNKMGTPNKVWGWSLAVMIYKNK